MERSRWTPRETHVSLFGLRSAVRAVAAAAELRRGHERAGRTPPYDVAVRLRPDLYRRRNFRRNTRGSYRGIPVNQVCSVPSSAWPAIVGAAAASRPLAGRSCVRGASSATCVVRGCDDETLPGNKSGDMCFWSAPPTAIDRLVTAWDALADEYLEANLCWQQWRQRQLQLVPARGAQQLVQAVEALHEPLHRSRGGGRTSRSGAHSLPVFRADERSSAPAPCAHPETQWEGSAAELVLSSAARREGLGRAPLHDGGASAAHFVPRPADCT